MPDEAIGPSHLIDLPAPVGPTMAEMREAKHELEKQLFTLIDQFQDRFGILVRAINLTQAHYMSEDRDRLVDVRAEVRA